MFLICLLLIGLIAIALAKLYALPIGGFSMGSFSIRLCAACYVKSPCNQIGWQFKQTDRCKKHQLNIYWGRVDLSTGISSSICFRF